MNQQQRLETVDPGSDRIAAAIVVALLGLVGGWTASGALGLLGHPLRHAITWLAFAGVLLAVVPLRRRWSFAILLLGVLLGVAMTAARMVTVNVCGVAVVLSAAALTQAGRSRTTIFLAAEAVALLAVFHFARTSIPFVWMAADAVGLLSGRLAATITGRPLWVGATFGGLDYFLVSTYLAVMAPLRYGSLTGGSRARVRHPIAWGLAAVAAGHIVYLVCLSFAPAILDRLPEAVHQTRMEAYYGPPTTSVADLARHLVPWNMLILAMGVHVVVVGGIFLYASPASASLPQVAGPRRGPPARRPPAERSRKTLRWPAVICAAAVVLLAVSIPLSVAPSSRPASLQGKKIVFYEKGFLNWLSPQHGNYGRLSIGMYGMLPLFLESLGARPLISPDLSEEELRDADALVLIFPNEPWKVGQLERIWDFVRGGGCLLVMGEHTTRESGGGSRFNDVLAPTAMQVRFDSATFAVGGWLQSYEALWHPFSAGVKDTENDFGVVIGASVATRPPARPLLSGRWGWADPGDVTSDAAMMGNGRYDAGEKLGDVVLAAEQSFGEGKIIAFGDTSTLSNGINIACHGLTSRLIAYAADRDARPLASWRQLLALLLAAAFVVIVAAGTDPSQLAACVLALSGTLVVCTGNSRNAGQLLPDGNKHLAGKRLAYVDASHLEAFSRESWREDGTAGLCLTLMRNDYLTLALPEICPDRLRGAELLISIAPSRRFRRKEREVIKEFIRNGGTFLCTVGHDRGGPSGELLEELGFKVGAVNWAGGRPEGGFDPLGHFKSPYIDRGDYLAFVRFHAAWPVYCTDKKAVVVTVHPPDKPVIVVRRLGRGLAAVVGDTCFAMNKNLERDNGEPFEGLRENADFWQWFLTLLRQSERGNG